MVSFGRNARVLLTFDEIYPQFVHYEKIRRILSHFLVLPTYLDLRGIVGGRIMTAKSQRKYTESVKEAFVQRQSSIILGLIGKTGSGCSTVASILSTASFSELGLPTPKNSDFKDTNERKYTMDKYHSHRCWL